MSDQTTPVGQWNGKSWTPGNGPSVTPSQLRVSNTANRLIETGMDWDTALKLAQGLRSSEAPRRSEARMLLSLNHASVMYGAEHAADLLADMPAKASAADLLALLRAEADAMHALYMDELRAEAPEPYTVARVAELTGLSQGTVRSYVARGQMPAPTGKIGRSPIWAPEAIERWIDNTAQRQGQPT